MGVRKQLEEKVKEPCFTGNEVTRIIWNTRDNLENISFDVLGERIAKRLEKHKITGEKLKLSADQGEWAKLKLNYYKESTVKKLLKDLEKKGEIYPPDLSFEEMIQKGYHLQDLTPTFWYSYEISNN